MMEAITRIVSESLARHGFDRPLDYRRLHWSRWFRCESHHSLLVVPSKPGVFALAEEITDFGSPGVGGESGKPEGDSPRRVLAVTQFLADEDMAFVLDRMLAKQNPMRERLISGRYFVRFVVIEDEAQRRSICNSLNQWIAGSSEKASGIGAHFATSIELSGIRVARASSPAVLAAAQTAEHRAETNIRLATGSTAAPQLDSGTARMHCPAPFPSGF